VTNIFWPNIGIFSDVTEQNPPPVQNTKPPIPRKHEVPVIPWNYRVLPDFSKFHPKIGGWTRRFVASYFSWITESPFKVRSPNFGRSDRGLNVGQPRVSLSLTLFSEVRLEFGHRFTW
jgi:hypothetical protein